jgi:hypothetical protein
MSTTTLRQLRGRQVRVRCDRGEIQGTMLSTTRHSVWLLVGDEDVIIERGRVGAVQLV